MDQIPKPYMFGLRDLDQKNPINEGSWVMIRKKGTNTLVVF